MRPIDADALIKWCVYCADDDIVRVNRQVMIYMLEHAPTVDAVPVVRCKDCIRYAPFKDVDGVCLAHNTGVLIVMSQNGYCNLGVRKEDAYEEPEINPCRGCEDYDGKGGCLSNGGCGAKMDEVRDE